MGVDSVELTVRTGQALVVDLTDRLSEFCRGRGDGLVNVYLPHATAGLALMETGSGSEPDLTETLGRLLPRDDRYRHRHGSTGHGADHLLPAFVAPTLTLPVFAGRPALGAWQRLVLVDSNTDNPTRRVRLSFLPGEPGCRKPPRPRSGSRGRRGPHGRRMPSEDHDPGCHHHQRDAGDVRLDAVQG